MHPQWRGVVVLPKDQDWKHSQSRYVHFKAIHPRRWRPLKPVSVCKFMAWWMECNRKSCMLLRLQNNKPGFIERPTSVFSWCPVSSAGPCAAAHLTFTVYHKQNNIAKASWTVASKYPMSGWTLNYSFDFLFWRILFSSSFFLSSLFKYKYDISHFILFFYTVHILWKPFNKFGCRAAIDSALSFRFETL